MSDIKIQSMLAESKIYFEKRRQNCISIQKKTKTKRIRDLKNQKFTIYVAQNQEQNSRKETVLDIPYIGGAFSVRNKKKKKKKKKKRSKENIQWRRNKNKEKRLRRQNRIKRNRHVTRDETKLSNKALHVDSSIMGVKEDVAAGMEDQLHLIRMRFEVLHLFQCPSDYDVRLATISQQLRVIQHNVYLTELVSHEADSIQGQLQKACFIFDTMIDIKPVLEGTIKMGRKLVHTKALPDPDATNRNIDSLKIQFNQLGAQVTNARTNLEKTLSVFEALSGRVVVSWLDTDSTNMSPDNMDAVLNKLHGWPTTSKLRGGTGRMKRKATDPVEFLPKLVASSFQTIPWVVNAGDRLRYEAVFKETDRDKAGFVSRFEMKNVFLQTGLPQNILAHIWNLCDMNDEGKLNPEQFALAMYLVDQKQAGKDPPPALTPDMVPPTMRQKTAAGEVVTEGRGSRSLYNNSELEQMAKEIQELLQEKMQLEREVQELVYNISVKNMETHSLQSKFDTLNSTLTQLTNQKNIGQKFLDDLDAQINKLKSQADDQEASLNVQEEVFIAEIDRSEAQMEAINNNISDVEILLIQTQKRIKEMEDAQKHMKEAHVNFEAAIAPDAAAEARNVPDMYLDPIRISFSEPDFSILDPKPTRPPLPQAPAIVLSPGNALPSQEIFNALFSNDDAFGAFTAKPENDASPDSRADSPPALSPTPGDSDSPTPALPPINNAPPPKQTPPPRRPPLPKMDNNASKNEEIPQAANPPDPREPLQVFRDEPQDENMVSDPEMTESECESEQEDLCDLDFNLPSIQPSSDSNEDMDNAEVEKLQKLISDIRARHFKKVPFAKVLNSLPTNMDCDEQATKPPDCVSQYYTTKDGTEADDESDEFQSSGSCKTRGGFRGRRRNHGIRTRGGTTGTGKSMGNRSGDK